MSVTLTINVPQGKTQERIDVYLTHCIENATRTKVQAAIQHGLVLVNGEPTKQSHKVAPGEIIEITLPKNPLPKVVPENIPLDIVHEDEYLLVVNKPAGMVTHPAFGNYSGTLVNALLFHYAQLSTINDETRPGIVHRLDKNTSGLLVCAKDDVTHSRLAKQFSLHTIEREYWAIVWGIFPVAKRKSSNEKSGIIDAPLGRSNQNRKRITVRDDGKNAITEYIVLEEFSFLTLLRLRLRTGRTHQIRAHLQHIAHPVFGDSEYGGRKSSYGEHGNEQKEFVEGLFQSIHRQALHAKTLGFLHPKTNEFLRFESDVPNDFQSVLNVLRNTQSFKISEPEGL
ncbi:MAG: RluA family pseudouridine synthase [Ignavibacteria bacterium]|nr:RluA family pseudouridine synthase [Ignavibacteria bacterium]